MIKTGDKIRVTTNEYWRSCPRGTICTVTSANELGGIWATIDGGDGVEWYFFKGQYEPLEVTESEKLTISKVVYGDDKGSARVILSNGYELDCIMEVRATCAANDLMTVAIEAVITCD